MNRAQIQTVVEDLEYLSSDWVKDISDPEVRRGSAILRRLLVEDATVEHGERLVSSNSLKSQQSTSKISSAVLHNLMWTLLFPQV